MRIRKKKSHTRKPYCDGVRTSTVEELKYNFKNSPTTRNTDISVRRIPLATDNVDNHPLIKSRSKQRFI